MKCRKFEEPTFEVVRFDDNVITASGCGCFIPELPDMENDCTGDLPAGCKCKVNYDSSADANCIPCTNYSK